MTTVKLYGHLGQAFGREHQYAVRTPAEAMRALMATLPGFRAYLIKHSAPGYKVLTAEGAQTLDTMSYPAGGIIRIVPVVAGAGKGFTSLLLGVVLVGVGLFLTGGTALTLSAAWAGGASTTIGFFATNIGIALALGGIAQMLSPQARTESYEAGENKPGYMFNGAINTSAQGNPLALCYGRMRVGSQVISAGINTEHIAYIPPAPPPNPKAGTGGGSYNDCVSWDDSGNCLYYATQHDGMDCVARDNNTGDCVGYNYVSST